MYQNDEVCLGIQSVSLCLFTGELSPLMLRDIMTNGCYFLLFWCWRWYYLCAVLFFGVCYDMISWLFLGIVTLRCVWVFILCRAGLVEKFYLNVAWSWNTLDSPSMVIVSFAQYNSLGWHLLSLIVCKIFVQDPLPFRFSFEKLGVTGNSGDVSWCMHAATYV